MSSALAVQEKLAVGCSPISWDTGPCRIAAKINSAWYNLSKQRSFIVVAYLAVSRRLVVHIQVPIKKD